MQLIDHSNDIFNVKLTRDELFTVNNALNEIINGMDVPEFETRIGTSLEQAKRLLSEVSEALDV